MKCRSKTRFAAECQFLQFGCRSDSFQQKRSVSSRKLNSTSEMRIEELESSHERTDVEHSKVDDSLITVNRDSRPVAESSTSRLVIPISQRHNIKHESDETCDISQSQRVTTISQSHDDRNSLNESRDASHHFAESPIPWRVPTISQSRDDQESSNESHDALHPFAESPISRRVPTISQSRDDQESSNESHDVSHPFTESSISRLITTSSNESNDASHPFTESPVPTASQTSDESCEILHSSAESSKSEPVTKASQSRLARNLLREAIAAQLIRTDRLVWKSDYKVLLDQINTEIRDLTNEIYQFSNLKEQRNLCFFFMLNSFHHHHFVFLFRIFQK
jgi:hypothetical protein